MTFRWSSWLAAVALVLVMAACGGAGEPDAPAPAVETRTFAGENGEVTIPVHPQRVVATGYAVPALIEAGAPLVGISSWTRGVPMMSPDELATYERLDKVAGESAADTNYEAIALADRSEEIPLAAPSGVTVRWAHRGSVPAGTGDDLERAVRSVELPAGERTFVWVAAEAGVVKPLRRWVRDRGVPAGDFRIVGYWKRGVADFDDED